MALMKKPKNFQRRLLERILNTRFEVAGSDGNWTLQVKPKTDIWTYDIIAEVVADSTAQGSNKTFTVTNGHWKENELKGRYLIVFPTANTHEEYAIKGNVPDPATSTDILNLKSGTPTSNVPWKIISNPDIIDDLDRDLEQRTLPGFQKPSQKHSEWLIGTNADSFKKTNAANPAPLTDRVGEINSLSRIPERDHKGLAPKRFHPSRIDETLAKVSDQTEQLELFGDDNLLYEGMKTRMDYQHVLSMEEGVEKFVAWIYEVHQTGGTTCGGVSEIEYEKIECLMHYWLYNELDYGSPDNHDFY